MEKIKRIKFLKSLILIIPILIVFYPLFSGKNFLPFSSYTPYYYFLKTTSCPDLKEDKLFNITWQSKELGLRELDFSGLSLHYPTYYFIAENLKRWVLPLWDPYVGAGVPTFGSGQYKPFNPFFILFYLKSNTHLYSFSVFLMLIFGIFCMFHFLKSLNLNDNSSILGSLIFVFNPYVYHRLSLTDTQSYFLLPLVMLIFSKLEKLDLIDFLKATSVLIFLGHIGHNEVNFLIAIFGWLFFFIFNKNSFFKKILFSVFCALYTLLALAIYIFPFMLNFLKGQNYKLILSHLKVFTTFRDFFVVSSDINTLPFLIVLLLLGFLSREKKIIFFKIGLIFSIFYFLRIPFLGSLVEELKITSINPIYFKLFYWFCISILISFGFELFLKRDKWVMELSVFLISFLLMLYISSKLIFPLRKYFKYLILFYFLSFIPFIFLILVKRDSFRERIKREIISLILVLFIVAPFVYPLSINILMWNECDIKTCDYIDFLKEKYPNSRVASLATYFKDPFPPNLGTIFSLKQIEINTFIFPNYLLNMVKDYTPVPTLLVFNKFNEEFFKRLGVDFVLVPRDKFFLDQKRLIFGNEYVDIYSLGSNLNRAIFAEKITCLSSFENFDFKRMKSQSSKSVFILSEKQMDYNFEGNGEIAFLKDDLHELILKVKSDKDSFLVLKDNFDRDWKVFIDGKKDKSYLVDGSFRGVFIPKGEHEVKWEYSPEVVYISGILSIIFHFGALIIFFWARKAK